MKVRDIMRTPVISLPQNSPLDRVLKSFVQHHIDSLPIVDAALRVVGFITMHELIDFFLPRYDVLLRDFGALQDKGQLASLFDAAFQGLDGNERLILAADVMNTRWKWIQSGDSLLSAASRLRSQKLQRLPVVDRDGKLVGLISDFDIVLAILSGSAATRVSATPAI